jgi:hypothetical protein
MFNLKNRAVQIQLVKTDTATNADPIPAPDNILDPAQITQIATDVAVKVVGAIGVAFAANRLLGAACDIAVAVTKAKLK